MKSQSGSRPEALLTFAEGAPVVPILVQRDPDPDGMASALGVRTLLDRPADETPIVSLGTVVRPENLRLAEVLDIRVTRVTEAELAGFRRVVAVDTQPGPGASDTRWAVIDHHPPRPGYTAEFLDIRPHLGAAATMVTQYLRELDPRRVTPRLATALIYGIRTDTDVLRRGATAEDVEAYAFLQPLADQELLRTIGRPTFRDRDVAAMGRALAGVQRRGDVAVAYLGRLVEHTLHLLPTVAELCLSIEGVSWSAAGGLLGDDMVVAIRRSGGGVGAGAGDLAATMADAEGRGGGHPSMARVAVRVGAGALAEIPGDAASTEFLLTRALAGVEALRAVR